LKDFQMATSTSAIIKRERCRAKGCTNGLMVTPMMGSGLRGRSTAMGFGKLTLATIILGSGSRT
jgi:hypothetical protein